MDIEYGRDPGSGDQRTAVRLRSRTLAGGAPAYYPLDSFLDGGDVHVPSQRIGEALSLFWQLSERASRLRLGSWRLLPDEELPEAWRRGTQRGNMGHERDLEVVSGGLRLSSNRDGPVVQEGALERLLFIDLVGRRL